MSSLASRSAMLFACGKTPEGRGYCWGSNFGGVLGTGNTGGSSTPVPVAGPMP